MKVRFDWVRQTPQHHVFVAHFPGFEKGVTFPIPKVLVPREEGRNGGWFEVEFPMLQLPQTTRFPQGEEK